MNESWQESEIAEKESLKPIIEKLSEFPIGSEEQGINDLLNKDGQLLDEHYGTMIPDGSGYVYNFFKLPNGNVIESYVSTGNFSSYSNGKVLSAQNGQKQTEKYQA